MTERMSIEEYLASLKKKKKKFNNEIIRDRDGKKIADSKQEYHDGEHLLWLVRSGHISDLSTQVNFPLVVNGVHICTYRADFTFLENSSGERMVLETKGFATPEYKIKRNLMTALHPEIRFLENWHDIKRR